MTKMQEQCVYVCGPYQGYCGRAEFEDGVFHGEVVGTRDVITFQGKTPADLRSAFVDSVDDYLAFCESEGETPEKPFSGRFVARLEPELHKAISNMAHAVGKSLNQFICDCLADIADKGVPAAVLEQPSRSRKTISLKTKDQPKGRKPQKAPRKGGRRSA
ncbi:MAG: type II toxin-antitoxin system HicB family antitoxin [Planctomycetales bacterium]|nr:type II toxin-antitoxin system HicB family antitoxin [Planctomycetales bacterium]